MSDMLGIKNEIKSLLAKEGHTITSIVRLLNAKHDKEDSSQNLNNKLSKETIRYNEVKEIADILGYDLVWVKRKE